MARINLLPWRDWRRERLKKEFFVILAGMALAGAAVVLAAMLVYGQAIGAQNERNAHLSRNIQDLEKQVAEIEKLQAQKKQMQERIDVVQNLQANRSIIVRLLDALVQSLPDGVYFRALELKGDALTIDGTAEANARISSLMRALDESDLFVNPNLMAVKANPEFGESASDFKLTVKLVVAGAAEKAAADAAAAAASKKRAPAKKAAPAKKK